MVNNEAAENLKSAGNEAFKKKDFEGALKLNNDALKEKPDEQLYTTILSNRYILDIPYA